MLKLGRSVFPSYIIKPFVRRLDLLVFGGQLYKIRNRLFEWRLKRDLRRKFPLWYEVTYTKDEYNEFARLCDLYGSDKGEIKSVGHPYPHPSHNYADIYQSLFSHCRESVRLVVECGIGTNDPTIESNMSENGKPGASLRVWRDYFPQANVVGIDIDAASLFEEERIRTFCIDQTSAEEVARFVADLKSAFEIGVDIFIDDGLHRFHAGRNLFEGTIDCLQNSGIYVIEDVGPNDLIQYRDYFSERLERFHVEFVNLFRRDIALSSNSVVVVRKRF